MAPLLSQFVCVRVINANALDLTRFQFDYDLSFSVMFFNADGAVYGRYGSWSHQKNAQDKTTAGFKRALEGALALHQTYPASREWISGKQGAPSPFKTPLDIPTLTGKYRLELDWNGKVVPSYVHCHQIGDALRLEQRSRLLPMASEMIYPWPAPETIGLRMAPDQAARVTEVLQDSAAARAGIRAGDELVSLSGQRLISIADVSWTVHQAPESGSMPVVIRRDGGELRRELHLQAGWRRKADISRRVGTWGLRGMATGGLLLVDLDDEARRQRGLASHQMGLAVEHVGQYGKHAAAKKAGFQKDDILVRVDALSTRLTESELFGHLLQKFNPGDLVRTTVLRGTERIELSLPMQ